MKGYQVKSSGEKSCPMKENEGISSQVEWREVMPSEGK